MSFSYTKEMVFDEFKLATKKDQKGKKEKYTNRVQFLKEMKQLKKDALTSLIILLFWNFRFETWTSLSLVITVD